MKFSLSVCASAMLMVPLSAAAETSGMYYCNGAVFADVAKTRVIGYSPLSKLTVKVTSEDVTITGDYTVKYFEPSIKDTSPFVYAQNYGGNFFILDAGPTGILEFTFVEMLTFSVEPYDAVRVARGTCQKW